LVSSYVIPQAADNRHLLIAWRERGCETGLRVSSGPQIGAGDDSATVESIVHDGTAVNSTNNFLPRTAALER